MTLPAASFARTVLQGVLIGGTLYVSCTLSSACFY